MSRRKIAGLTVAAMVLTAVAVLAPSAPAQAAPGYPGGRAYYVTAVTGGTQLNHFVRLAEEYYDGGGKVHEWYWVWNQNMVDPTRRASYYKPATGYVTNGCFAGCSVRTAIGFQPSAAPKQRDGTYGFNAAGQLAITWSSGQTETWGIRQLDGLARMDMVKNNYAPNVNAWSFGSTKHFGYAATMDQIMAAGDTQAMFVDSINAYEKNYITYRYKSPDDPAEYGETHFFPRNWERCTGSPCVENIEMRHPTCTGGTCSTYYAYLAGNPTVDHRKNYFNGQNQATHDGEDPNRTNPCITVGGGHTYDLLQIIDDSGNFRGWVQGEASLDQKATSHDMVSIFYVIKTATHLP